MGEQLDSVPVLLKADTANAGTESPNDQAHPTAAKATVDGTKNL